MSSALIAANTRRQAVAELEDSKSVPDSFVSLDPVLINHNQGLRGRLLLVAARTPQPASVIRMNG